MTNPCHLINLILRVGRQYSSHVTLTAVHQIIPLQVHYLLNKQITSQQINGLMALDTIEKQNKTKSDQKLTLLLQHLTVTLKMAPSLFPSLARSVMVSDTCKLCKVM